MDNVVEYLGHQENVEVLKRIKLGGTQPFMTDGRSVSEVVVAKIDEGKAQRLRAAAPPHLIIERDIRVIGERDQPLARATVVIEGNGLPAQALTDETGTARLTFFGGTVEAIQTLFISRIWRACRQPRASPWGLLPARTPRSESQCPPTGPCRSRGGRGGRHGRR